VEKLELLSRIRKLSSLVHSEDLKHYNFTEDSIKELHSTLDKLTEEYITSYC
jgi:ribosome recycling factor